MPPDRRLPSRRHGYQKLLAWHPRKVAEQAILTFQEELFKYCESDVKLLDEGCLKFVREFEEIAGFNPLVKSVTIARACNLFGRKETLEQDLIALEPQCVWRGNNINQSKIAMEWLYYEDHKLGGMNRIRHVKNGGEVQVLTPAEMYYSDGYYETTHTVYGFYGCYLCGYPRCFKRQRDVKRNCHKDRTVQEVYEATVSSVKVGMRI